MTIARPSVSVVTEAIVDGILARNPAGQVWDGPAPEPEGLAMYIGWSPSGPSVTYNQTLATIGMDGRRNEDYELAVHCSAISADDSATGRRALREDTWGLFGVLADYLADNRDLGGRINGLAELLAADMIEDYLDPDDNVYQTGISGRVCAIDSHVRITNQLI